MENKRAKTMAPSKVTKAINWILIMLTVIFTLLGMLIYRITDWVLQTWGLISIDEIIFHLKVPLGGANTDMIKEAVMFCLPPMLICTVVVGVILYFLRDKKKYQYSSMVIAVVITGIMAGTGVSTAWNELSVSAYIENRKTKSTFIEEHYADPSQVKMNFPEQKRNLIYIFLESMENTYADITSGGGFKENYIPELTNLANENINFSNSENLGGAAQTVGTTWTIGGMFGQTSGMPLILPVSSNAMSEQEKFFPKIKSIGDILEENGYNQSLLIGSSASFGGRDKYFDQHGNYNIYDYDYAIENQWIPSDYRVFWGYEDLKLFENARRKLSEIAKEEEPFNFTMLTVDTHFEDGYVCDVCQKDYDNQYANVMSCSSKQLADFVQWIKEQDFYENTTIVISGDHFTMDSDFCKELDVNYQRTVYNTIINSAVEPVNEKKRVFTTLDMFPTTLASLGVEIEGNRLALGTNLFSDEKTLAETYTLEYMNLEFNRGSEFYDTFTEDIVVHWRQVGDKWYYYDIENNKLIGWQQINDKWYFFKENGEMASDEWIDGYYLRKDGDWDGLERD